LSEFLLLRLYNVYLLVSIFKLEGDFKRILKYLDMNNKSNINLGDTLLYISRRSRVKKEIAFYALHILTLKAGA
jgi:hypothetical protein